MPGFPSVGGGELLILLVIILLLFGAKRIPELARSLGKGTREFRKAISEGTTEDEVQEDRKHKEDEKESSLDRETRDEKPRAETARAKPKT